MDLIYMMIGAFMEEFRHLEEMKLATKNFEDINVIESGECENLYKEFMMVSHYSHIETLVSLRHLVAMIMRRSLFTRYNGSLDCHLKVGALTSSEICVGVAWGLNYVHNKKGIAYKVLHRDIKSANI